MLCVDHKQGTATNPLENVGIFLPEPVFPHGQLYVAFSRSKSFEGIKLSAAAINEDSQYSDNIVYRSVLESTWYELNSNPWFFMAQLVDMYERKILIVRPSYYTN